MKDIFDKIVLLDRRPSGHISLFAIYKPFPIFQIPLYVKDLSGIIYPIQNELLMSLLFTLEALFSTHVSSQEIKTVICNHSDIWNSNLG